MSAPTPARVLGAVKASGVKFVAVKGWDTCDPGWVIPGVWRPAGVLLHHTANSGAPGNNPSLGWVVAPGSLAPVRACHFLISRDGTVNIICAEGCYHAGGGGPLKVPGVTIPVDQGNAYFFGIEIESKGTDASVTAKPTGLAKDADGFTPAQVVAATNLTAALLLLLNKTETSVFRHRDWAPGRKDDVLQPLTFWRPLIKARLAIVAPKPPVVKPVVPKPVVLAPKPVVPPVSVPPTVPPTVHVGGPAPKPAPKPAAVEGVDYSFGRPTPASLVAAGKHFAIRYLSGGGTKDLAAAEAAALHKAGLGIVLVWENGGKAALGGAAQGTLDATKALKQATALGAPKTTPIYLAVDFDATTAQKPTVLAYFAAASKILTPARTGIYAGVNPITWLIAAKTAQWYWLTYAWQGSAAIPAATHLYQYKNDQSIGGAGVDFDRALRPAFGAWLPLPVPVVPKPVVLAPKPVVQPPAPKPIVTPVSVPPVVQPPVQPVHVGPTPPVTVGGPAPIQPAPVVVPPPPVVVNWTSTPATKPSWWAAWVAWVTKWLH